VRYLVLTLAVLGGLTSAGLGYKWMSDAREVRPALYALLQSPDFARVAANRQYIVYLFPPLFHRGRDAANRQYIVYLAVGPTALQRRVCSCCTAAHG
jgi:hypothetical protein